MQHRQINILVTLNENYIPYLNVMLRSLIDSNTDCHFHIYLLHRSMSETAAESTKRIIGAGGELHMIKVADIDLSEAPTTARYPQEIYYRIFAAKYLPSDIDKILYLDPDIIVNGSVKELYDTDMDDYFFAAASHNGALMHKVNEIRLDIESTEPYINSGVMLMNLKKLRKEQDYKEVFEFIEKRKNLLILPDQDIISALYGSRILELDPFVYNMTERLYILRAQLEKEIDMEWVRKNSVIIHYCGKNKPWKRNYIGHLDVFYNETLSKLKT